MSSLFGDLTWLRAVCGEGNFWWNEAPETGLPAVGLRQWRRWGVVPTLSMPPFTPAISFAKFWPNGQKSLREVINRLPTVADCSLTADLHPAQLPLFHRTGFRARAWLTYQYSLSPEIDCARYFNRNRRRELKAVAALRPEIELIPLAAAEHIFASHLAERNALAPGGLALHRLAPFYGPNGPVQALGVRDEMNGEKWAAALLTVRDGTRAHALYNARSAAASGQLSYLYRRQINALAAAGVTHFDFNGSMLPGVTDYLGSFGGEAVTRYRLRRSVRWLAALRALKGG